MCMCVCVCVRRRPQSPGWQWLLDVIWIPAVCFYSFIFLKVPPLLCSHKDFYTVSSSPTPTSPATPLFILLIRKILHMQHTSTFSLLCTHTHTHTIQHTHTHRQPQHGVNKHNSTHTTSTWR